MSSDNEMARPEPGQKPVNASLLIGLALFLVTLALYWPATQYPFLFFDDKRYVTENPWVQDGFSWAGLHWAFTTLDAEFWHPLTWISYMLDHSVYGAFAGGYHLTNALLHAVNSVLLFVWLKRATRALWASALVAALFAWHPLHVESVAWIAERKDLLSTFFLLLTLLAYTSYVEKKTVTRYLLALGLFTLGLMSKPMLVTLPCLLLLLDYWPLHRVSSFKFQVSGSAAPQSGSQSLSQLVLEKVPFFLLALAAGVVTIVAQRLGGSLKTVGQVPMDLRTLNALDSYARYLVHTVWPFHLCAYYPLPITLPVVQAACAVLVLAGISFLVFRRISTCPWLTVGWLWYLVALLPVSGLLQVGKHAMADRYTYIPLIGVFLAAAWGLRELVKTRPQTKNLAVGLAVVSLLACLWASRVQLGYWRDDIAVFGRVVAVTENNPIGEGNYGVALANAGRTQEAIVEYQRALRLAPGDAGLRYNLGSQLVKLGDWEQAGQLFAEALKINPNDERSQNDYGLALVQQGKPADALAHFQAAIQLRPDYSKAYFNSAMVLQMLGQSGPALTNYAKALEIEPDWPEALNAMAILLATCPDAHWRNPVLALKLAGRANEITSQESALCLDALAIAYAANGVQTKAIATETLALDAAKAEALPDLVAKLAGHLASLKSGQIPQPDVTSAIGLSPASKNIGRPRN